MVKKGEQMKFKNELACLSDSHFPVPFSTDWHYYRFLVHHPETVYTFMSIYKYLHIHEHTQHMLFCSSPFLIIAHTRAHSGPLRLEATHSTAADVLDCFSWIKLFLSTTNSAAVNILGFES